LAREGEKPRRVRAERFSARQRRSETTATRRAKAKPDSSLSAKITNPLSGVFYWLERVRSLAGFEPSALARDSAGVKRRRPEGRRRSPIPLSPPK